MERKRIVNILRSNKTLLENFSYISLLQVFILITPLITYPYLTRTLGTELYGLVITAQVLASYALIVVKFGFDAVSARHVSINRDDTSKLSVIVSSILTSRFLLWVASLFLYMVVVFIVPIYRAHFLLFFFSFGVTFSTLLFPQFFFQGIEKMKYITIINVLIQAVFIGLTFIVIRTPEDYFYVPLLHAIGYIIGGAVSLIVLFKKYKLTFKLPTVKQTSYYFKDALPLFATDAVCTIKDKLNYLLLGAFVNMSDVVIYDVGSKLTSLAIQPLTIINTTIFPKMAKNKSNKSFLRFGAITVASIILLVVAINIFLPEIVKFLIGEDVPLSPIRFYLLAPIFLGVSSFIGSSFIVARGYNKIMFYSIIITTAAYLGMLGFLHFSGQLTTVMAFVSLAVFSYMVEMIYRIYITRKIIKKEQL